MTRHPECGDGIGTMNKIDVPALKARLDLCGLAGRYTTLKPWGRRGELAGPCPQARCPADEDGFHVHPDGWWNAIPAIPSGRTLSNGCSGCDWRRTSTQLACGWPR